MWIKTQKADLVNTAQIGAIRLVKEAEGFEYCKVGDMVAVTNNLGLIELAHYDDLNDANKVFHEIYAALERDDKIFIMPRDED